MSDSYIDHLKLISVAKKGFDYWLECICYDKPEIYNIYDGNPNQVSMIQWYNYELPNIIIRMENLNKDFYKIQDLLTNGLNRNPIPCVNTTSHRPYQEYYNFETKKMVLKKFEEDLDIFKYTF
jgi:hypothetical protein